MASAADDATAAHAATADAAAAANATPTARGATSPTRSTAPSDGGATAASASGHATATTRDASPTATDAGPASKNGGAAQRFAKLRASRPAAAEGGAGSGGSGKNKAIIVANKKFQQQKLQEFRNRQALKGPKDTKQDVATKTTGKEITPFVVGNAPAQLKFKPTTGVKIDATKNATTTVLGNYEKDMRHIIKELKYPKTLDFRSKVGGYNILNTPNTLYKSPKQFWEKYNKPFLDKAIKRGDRIILASKPTDVNNLRRTNLNTGQVEKTGFARELEYLRSKGYKYDPKTSSMVPK